MAHSHKEHLYCLNVSCPDRVGIVAALSQFIAKHNGWLTESNYHADAISEWFFMRNEIRADSLSISLEAFKHKFSVLANEFQMQWHIQDNRQPQKVAILVSRASHCLADLLHRCHSNELFCDISCVISNHNNLQSMVKWYGIPFHHVVPNDTHHDSHSIGSIINDYQADTIVLARYMQIIPPLLCQKYAGRMINIHHSFLPSFIGANPYQKAYERGVKLIGASSHYVTENLDEGPIIEQDVMLVSHRHSKEDLVRLGKDVEKLVLARALRHHLEGRVFVHGNKTIVFN